MLPDNIGMEETKISAQQYTCKIMPFVFNNGNFKLDVEGDMFPSVCLLGGARGGVLLI